MKTFMNIFLLSIIITLFSNIVHAMGINFMKNNKENFFNNNQKIQEFEDIINNDSYYLVFVNYTLIANSDNQGHNKRHEENREEYINSVMDEIHNLIVGNIDTYKKPEIVEEIINESLQKRDENSSSNTVSFLSALNDVTVLTAYLSENLIDPVKDIAGVYDCVPNLGFEYHFDYNTHDIIDNTNWSDVEIRKQSASHLSLISQGKFNEDLISKYDNTYYYPKKAGEGIDIYVIDSSFNFLHSEFSNTDERTVKCLATFDGNGNVNTTISEKRCSPPFQYEHGSLVSDIIGGVRHGVAPKANIYGIGVEIHESYGDIIGALEYIKKYHLKEKKSVFNFSFGILYKDILFTLCYSFLEYFQNLIIEISKMGAVFVASAGNSNSRFDNPPLFPCNFEQVICVGATDNPIKINEEIDMSSNNYRLSNFTNYGDVVDIYAPGYFEVSYQNFDYTDINDFVVAGTSGSAPLVAGVAASIMSEHPDEFFDSNKMLAYLRNIGIKDAIKGVRKGHPSNVFLNNGKHIVYSEDDIYYGCGINSGYHKCKQNNCCSIDGYCTDNNDNLCEIKNGCQSNYGICNN